MSSGSVQEEAPCIIHPPRFMGKDKRKEKEKVVRREWNQIVTVANLEGQ